MEKVSAVYKITNTITGDFYIGSSKNVKQRWASHKWPSAWKNNPNKQLYKDMEKYGTDKFVFEIIAEVEIDSLKEKEQEFIETLKPTYNNYRANGLDVEKRKESQRKADKKYKKSDKYKQYRKEYQETDKYKQYHNKYNKTDKCKEYQKEYKKKYDNQLCNYNGQTLTLIALSTRFRRRGISNPTQEAKKYLIGGKDE